MDARRRRRRAVAILAVAVLIVIAAIAGWGPFGGGGSGSREDQVREAVVSLIHARNANDFATVCDGLAEQQVSGIKRSSGLTCPEALHSVPGATTIKTKIEVQDVRISGDRATVDATVHHNGGTGQSQSILLIKEDGAWKVASAGF